MWLQIRGTPPHRLWVKSHTVSTMPELIGFEFPAPGLFIPTHQDVVPRGLQRTVPPGDARDGVTPSVVRGPQHLPDVEAACHPHLRSHPVAAQLHGPTRDLLLAGGEQEVRRAVDRAPVGAAVSRGDRGKGQGDGEARRGGDGEGREG